MKIKIHKQFTKCFSKFNSSAQGLILKTIIGIKNENTASGLRLHKTGFYYSYSVNMNIRILTLFDKDEVTLVYVGNHDEAYKWGAKNKPICTHSTIVGFIDNTYMSKFSEFSVGEISKFNYLRKYGFQEDFIIFLSLLNEEKLLSFIEYIAPEYQELILFGEKEINEYYYSSDIVVINDDQELVNALKLSIDNWCIFLHSKQKYIVDYPNWKNLIIKGGPGTGKTVSIVHRFVKEYQRNKKKPVFLCYNQFTKNTVKTMASRLENVPDTQFIVFDDFKADTNGLQLSIFLNSQSHVFIDEAQDLNIYFASRLLQLLDNNEIKTSITMALDLNQSIFSSIGEAVKRLETYFDIINLNYCYRSTNQIIETAKNSLSNKESHIVAKDFQEYHNIEVSRDVSTRNICCPLSGSKVVTLKCENLKEILSAINKFIKTENLEIGENNWAIITACYNLKINIPQYKKNLFNATQVKGREFFKGIVISDYNNIEIRKAKQFKKIALNDYVAISRFREKLLYIQLEIKYDN